MPGLSNWREEFNLSEVVTGKMTDTEALKKVSEKKGINNKVTINPKLDEAVKEIGGEVIGMVEQDTTAQKQRIDMKQMILDRQKLKLRRKDLSQKKKEGEGVDSTNASKQADIIAQEETIKQVNEKKRKNALQIQKVIGEADLNAAERRALPDKDFALPGKGKGPEGKQAGSYPIPDEKHARSALSLVAQHGTPEEKATVRAKVKKKFPNIEVNEGVMKMVKRVMAKKKPEKKPSMDSITTKVHQWRKDREKEERRKYVSDFDPIDEAKVDTGKSPEEKEKDRNVRRFGVSHNVAGHGKLRRALHRSDRGYKKKKGDKSQYVEMEATDKAFEFVKRKIEKEVGKSGYVSKDNPMKPQTAAEKAKVRAHQAKIDKENAAERAKDPSQGRYPKGYSNRGSD